MACGVLIALHAREDKRRDEVLTEFGGSGFGVVAIEGRRLILDTALVDSLDPLQLDVRLACLSLHERVSKERARQQSPAPSTEAVGGITKLGARIEHLFRCVFRELLASTGEDPEHAFRRLTKQKDWRLETASAGQLARTVGMAASEVPPTDPLLRLLVAAASNENSPLHQCIRLRNGIVHERVQPSKNEMIALFDAVLAFTTPLVK